MNKNFKSNKYMSKYSAMIYLIYYLFMYQIPLMRPKSYFGLDSY